MANKAAQTQLDTFKMILDDIDTRVSCLNVDQHFPTANALHMHFNARTTSESPNLSCTELSLSN
jgi:hypothetical protein